MARRFVVVAREVFMNISSSIRSPLRERDCWPASGPVYAMPHGAAASTGGRTFWMKMMDRLSSPEQDDSAPVSPIYY
jgi:hypothetical protein